VTTTRPLVIAHRAAPTAAPEHTIPAYESAVAAGADGLWLPLRVTADGHLVVMADARLERTTDGRGPVAARTARELKRLDAGRWFGWRFRGQRVQMLSEALERFRGRARFAVELPGGSDLHPGIEERLLGLLALHGVAGDSLVVSADHHALRTCRRLDPDARTVARVGARLLAPAALAPPGVLHGVWLPAALTVAGDVTAARAAGLACYVEGVDDPARARELAEAGAAGLVTDRPDLVGPALDRSPGSNSQGPAGPAD
jgi:glycerophosphoryl diester phosphodiesterase